MCSMTAWVHSSLRVNSDLCVHSPLQPYALYMSVSTGQIHWESLVAISLPLKILCHLGYILGYLMIHPDSELLHQDVQNHSTLPFA